MTNLCTSGCETLGKRSLKKVWSTNPLFLEEEMYLKILKFWDNYHDEIPNLCGCEVSKTDKHKPLKCNNFGPEPSMLTCLFFQEPLVSLIFLPFYLWFRIPLTHNLFFHLASFHHSFRCNICANFHHGLKKFSFFLHPLWASSWLLLLLFPSAHASSILESFHSSDQRNGRNRVFENQ